jgi:hypothetical protein
MCQVSIFWHCWFTRRRFLNIKIINHLQESSLTKWIWLATRLLHLWCFLDFLDTRVAKKQICSKNVQKTNLWHLPNCNTTTRVNG